MLDKQLCAAFGIDEFNQWIMKQLDYIEDQLYASEVSSPRYIELKAKYEAFKAVRDAYCELNQKKLLFVPSSAGKKACENITYSFEISLFDRQIDPARFKTLTHHFDYICPLDLYSNVTVWDVQVDIHAEVGGHKVLITGFMEGEEASVALSRLDLTDWGDVSLLAIRASRITKNK